MSITAIETAIANDLADGNSRTAAGKITQLIRAVIADETPNIVKAMLNTPIEHTTVNLDGKTICTYPVVPEGDVPEWCKKVAEENMRGAGVSLYAIGDMVDKQAQRIHAAAESELTRRVAEATADKDRRIAELEAECERLRNARCNIFSKGNKCDCTLCKQDAEITTLRQQLADEHKCRTRYEQELIHTNEWLTADRGHFGTITEVAANVRTLIVSLEARLAEATRPVEDVDWDRLWNIPATLEESDRMGNWLKRIFEPLLQRERAARLAADKRATAAEAERDELREAWKRRFACVETDGNGLSRWSTELRDSPTRPEGDPSDAVLAAFRAEKGKVTK